MSAAPATATAATITAKIGATSRFSVGAGMTGGLEIHWDAARAAYVLHDASADDRFAADVSTWNDAIVGLNAKGRKKVKNAKK